MYDARSLTQCWIWYKKIYYKGPCRVIGLFSLLFFLHSLFTEVEIQEIRKTRYYDVLLSTTSAESGDLQENVFLWINGTINSNRTHKQIFNLLYGFRYLTTDSLSPIGDPCPQPQPITASMLYPCTNATSMSYFDSGSKAGFGIFVIALFFFPVGQYHVKFTLKSEIFSVHQ